MADEAPNPTEQAYASFTEDKTRVFDVQKAKFDYAKEKVALSLDNERWKNRRWMAWIALWSIIIATGAMFTVVPESRIEALDTVIVWFMMGMVSIVGTYIGTSTWANVSAARSARPAPGMGAKPWDQYGGGRLDQPGANKDNDYSEH